jgi:hypothetical protein
MLIALDFLLLPDAKMEAARTSETLVNFYQTTRRYNPEESHLRTHRRENLKSYILIQCCATVLLLQEDEFSELKPLSGPIVGG